MSLLDFVNVTDKRYIQSFIYDKYIVDYGTITTINGDGTVNIQHQVLSTFYGTAIPTPLTTINIELLYLSSSSLGFDGNPQIGDPVLLIGLRNFIPSTTTPMPPAYPPISPSFYSRSTMKAIPLSALNANSGVTIRAENAKLRIRNSQVSLFKILNDFTSAVNSFATNSGSATTASQIAGFAITLASAMANVITELNLLLEN